MQKGSSPFFGYPKGKRGRNGQPIIAIILHITDFVALEDNWEPFDRWFGWQGKVTPHYLIRRSGQIKQYVDEKDAAWTQGRIMLPDRTIPWINHLVISLRINPNLLCISIEHEGQPFELITPAQESSSFWLVADIARRHGIRSDGGRITGHFSLDSLTRANCWPGYPFAQLMQSLS
jgi:N-acetyl-anhydromuramyl-L-alanine amidase AmpD